MNDFRQYKGIDYSDCLTHFGVGHDKGGHSGRYPWGSGDRPKQALEGWRKGSNNASSSAKFNIGSNARVHKDDAEKRVSSKEQDRLSNLYKFFSTTSIRDRDPSMEKASDDFTRDVSDKSIDFQRGKPKSEAMKALYKDFENKYLEFSNKWEPFWKKYRAYYDSGGDKWNKPDWLENGSKQNQKEYYKLVKHFQDDIITTALNDMGIDNTKENRKMFTFLFRRYLEL